MCVPKCPPSSLCSRNDRVVEMSNLRCEMSNLRCLVLFFAFFITHIFNALLCLSLVYMFVFYVCSNDKALSLLMKMRNEVEYSKGFMSENKIWTRLSEELNTDGIEIVKHLHFSPQGSPRARGASSGFVFVNGLLDIAPGGCITESMLMSKKSSIFVYSSGVEWAGSLVDLVNQRFGTELQPIRRMA